MNLQKLVRQAGKHAFNVLIILSLLLTARFMAGLPQASAQDEIPPAVTETAGEDATPTPETPPILEETLPAEDPTPPGDPQKPTSESTPIPENTPTPDELPTLEAPPEAAPVPAWQILADGQFVYGPDLESFNLADYLASASPARVGYAEDIFGRSQYYSFNPRVMLALAEMASGWLTSPDANPDSPFGLGGGFLAELDSMAEVMVDAYYTHLYTYTAMDATGRSLPAFTLADGSSFQPAGETNAGSYAVMAGLAMFLDGEGMLQALELSQEDGFYRAYMRLFPGEDPLQTTNLVPGSGVVALAAPVGLLQLPYPVGDAWGYSGVHGYSGSGTDMSSMDFYTGASWGANTSDMWVVAAAAGRVKSKTSCYVEVDHGNGWSTSYYHLQSVQVAVGSLVSKNQHLAVIANTLAQAICNGGYSSGPHQHFTLRYNGALYPLNGSQLSGWQVHSGTFNYDYDCSRMYLTRADVKSCAFNKFLINDGGVPGDGDDYLIPVITSISPNSALAGDGNTLLHVYGSKFVSGAYIRWNGSNLTTTWEDNTHLYATIPASKLFNAGEATIDVFNPVPLGGASEESFQFTILPTSRCTAAISLGLPAAHTYNNSGTGSTGRIVEYPGWSKSESGPEYAYKFTAPMSGEMTVALGNVTAGQDLDLFVLDGAAGECHADHTLVAS